MALGERAVVAAGNVTDSFIITGDLHAELIEVAIKADEIVAEAYPPRLHQLPAPPADFTGRDLELKELRTALLDGNSPICGLVGMGGVGKTATALTIAREMTTSYPDAQILVDLQGSTSAPLTAAAIQAHVVSAFKPQATLPSDQAELAALYRTLLHGRGVLLLFDDARDADQLANTLPPANCMLIVTSRQNLVVPGMTTLRLDTLPTGDACQLLLRIAPRLGSQAGEMAALCGHLPLALRVAASTLAQHVDLTLTEYLEQLRGRRAGLDEVDASLGLSYELLGEELQRRWRQLVVFPGDFGPAAAATIWGIGREQARELLSHFVAGSLVEWDSASSRYRLHDLLRECARRRIPPAEEGTVRLRHAAQYRVCLAVAQNMLRTDGENALHGVQLFDLERTNIEAGQAWAVAHLEDNDDAARLCSGYAGEGALILALRLPVGQRIAWLEVALKAAERLGDAHARLIHSGNLANALRADGQLTRALSLYEEQEREALAQDDARIRSMALGNQSIAHGEIGDVLRARGLGLQQLRLARQLADRRQEMNALNNLAVLCSRMSLLRRARVLHEAARRIAQELGDGLTEARILCGLGNIALESGRLEEARRQYEAQVATAQRFGDQRQVALALGNLGHVHEELNEPAQALALHEQQLAIARQLGDRRSEAAALLNTGRVLLNLRQPELAIEHLEQAWALFQMIGDRGGEASAMGNLARLELASGAYERALELFGSIATMCRELHDPRGEATAYFHQAVALSRLKRYEAALAAGTMALDILRSIQAPAVAEVELFVRRHRNPVWRWWSRWRS